MRPRPGLVITAAFIGPDTITTCTLAGSNLGYTLLWIGSYATLERALCGFVVMMSACFILTALVARPDLGLLLEGMFLPRLSEESLYIALGLVGTTIVPYNLFLYSSIVQERWSAGKDLRTVRMDLLGAVLLGGGISEAVVTTASAAFFQKEAGIFNAADMAVQLQPLLGSWAKAAMAVGLFGAGMSSAITAPLATAYAVQGMCAWPGGLKETRFRMV